MESIKLRENMEVYLIGREKEKKLEKLRRELKDLGE